MADDDEVEMTRHTVKVSDTELTAFVETIFDLFEKSKWTAPEVLIRLAFLNAQVICSKTDSNPDALNANLHSLFDVTAYFMQKINEMDDDEADDDEPTIN